MDTRNWSCLPEEVLVRLSSHNKHLYATCPTVRKKVRSYTKSLSLRYLFAQWQLKGYQRLSSLHIFNATNPLRTGWLPTTLTDLKLVHVRVDSKLLSSIPSSVTSLSLNDVPVHFNSDRLATGGHYEKRRRSGLIALSDLPESITTCNFPFVIDEGRGMRKLVVCGTAHAEVGRVEELLDTTGTAIITHPAALKRLAMLGEVEVDLSPFVNLESFTHYQNSSIEIGWDTVKITDIPPSLHTLDMVCTRLEEIGLPLAALTNLKSLRLASMSTPSSIDQFTQLEELYLSRNLVPLSALPPTLKKLTAYRLTGKGTWPYLTELTIFGADSVEYHSSLPTTLRSLYLDFDEIDCDLNLTCLPRLADLTLSARTGYTLYIPPSVTTLDLAKYSGDCYYEHTSLLHLRLHPDADWKKLSPNLLSFHCRTIIDIKTAKRLPRGLRELHVNNVQTGAVHYLPRYLVVIDNSYLYQYDGEYGGGPKGKLASELPRHCLLA